MLEVEDLKVKMGNKKILDKISLKLNEGESYVLFGPNGSGKTTLLHAIMGLVPPKNIDGEIRFLGKDITNLSVEERAKLGISIGFQHPPEITGIKLSDLLKLSAGKERNDSFTKKERELIETLRLTDFLDREINVGFSGGERKRAETLQMFFLKPKLLLLDEPDSGVDVESLKLIGRKIQEYIKETSSSALIVTHQGGILEHVDVDHACVMFGKKIRCYPDPHRILKEIKEKGYKECFSCKERVTEGW